MQVEVRFAPSGRRVRVRAGTTLLAATQRAGLPVARACGERALCGRCGLLVVRGGETLAPEAPRERRAKRANRVDPRLRLSCQAALRGDLEVTAPYWGGDP